ncbi:polyketide synthase dehydratase domain-containing protein, partial [Streptomyces sp. NPDC059679]|uniref:polyketide synthase dehydratase domain-containing protein n=1 Tax=Streptomyces sp. NPDC059679 TaxID=3346903 RepID=UPI00368F2317
MLSETGTGPGAQQGMWPPVGVGRVDVDGLYEGFAVAGYDYGPLFRGVRAVWRGEDEVFAEVALDDGVVLDGFAVHPALLDAALHPLVLLDPDDGQGVSRARLPFSWTGVTLHASSARTLRVRLRATGPDTVRIQATDETGTPVASVESLVLRPVTPEQLVSSRQEDALHHLRWAPETPAMSTVRPSESQQCAVLGASSLVPLSEGCPVFADLAALRDAVEKGAPVPDMVVAVFISQEASSSQGLAVAARRNAAAALALVQGWLADERFVESRLVVVTRGAVAVGAGEDVVDLAHAPVWGLMRSVQREHPDRVWLADVDEADELPLPLLMGLADGAEPQVAVRDGAVRVPRLVPRSGGASLGPEAAVGCLDRWSGTVLITGGTGTLGALLARHLVTV